MSQIKRICIKDNQTGVIIRVWEDTAKEAVESGNYSYTSKSKYKHYLNNAMKEIKAETHKARTNHFKGKRKNIKNIHHNKKRTKGYNFIMIRINKNSTKLKKLLLRNINS